MVGLGCSPDKPVPNRRGTPPVSDRNYAASEDKLREIREKLLHRVALGAQDVSFLTSTINSSQGSQRLTAVDTLGTATVRGFFAKQEFVTLLTNLSKSSESSELLVYLQEVRVVCGIPNPTASVQKTLDGLRRVKAPANKYTDIEWRLIEELATDPNPGNRAAAARLIFKKPEPTRAALEKVEKVVDRLLAMVQADERIFWRYVKDVLVARSMRGKEAYRSDATGDR
jgi:hypothetical protein